MAVTTPIVVSLKVVPASGSARTSNLVATFANSVSIGRLFTLIGLRFQVTLIGPNSAISFLPSKRSVKFAWSAS